MISEHKMEDSEDGPGKPVSSTDTHKHDEESVLGPVRTGRETPLDQVMVYTVINKKQRFHSCRNLENNVNVTEKGEN